MSRVGIITAMFYHIIIFSQVSVFMKPAITQAEVFIGSKYKICGSSYVRDVISSATITSHYLLQ